MPLLSITRLQIRSFWFLIPFLWRNQKITQEVQKSPGFIEGKLLVDRKRVFWTATLWDSKESMLAFRNSGAHLKAMPKLKHWASKATYTHFETESEVFPNWETIYREITKSGIPSKTLYPTQNDDKSKIEKPLVSRFRERLLIKK